MTICCSNITDLGCVNACLPLNLGTAPVDGTYRLELSSGATYEQDFLALDPLAFNVPLNENYEYNMKKITPSGVEACYTFKTYYAPVIV